MKIDTIHTPHILLPKKGVDMTAFAVIACDQFTSELDYWDSLKKEIGNKPSTFNMMFPEAYLGKVDETKYIAQINKNIDTYLKDGVLEDIGECFILVERKTPYTPRRLGIMISIDLEDYSYQKGVRSLIRASEATIVERIPPRLKIRENATVELPHILFLFDDKDKEIVESLYRNKDRYRCVYDFELNKGGGHLKGYAITDVERVKKQFYSLLEKNNSKLLFIVGDGNHSLATAKAHWDKIKISLSDSERKIHPARFALVEAINLYDEGLAFEPIHRIVFNAQEDFLPELKKRLSGNFVSHVYSHEGKDVLKMPSNAPQAYKIVQGYIDEYLKAHRDVSVDYIHDVSHLIEVAKKNPGSIAIEMPALTKGDVFTYIANDEVLPKKSFSMGNAKEKRYYLESKRIK